MRCNSILSCVENCSSSQFGSVSRQFISLTVFSVKKSALDLALWHCTSKVRLRQILLMLQGRVIFGTVHTRILRWLILPLAWKVASSLNTRRCAMVVYKVSKKFFKIIFNLGQSSGSSFWITEDLWGFMWTRLRRTCHPVVLGICNSRLPWASIENGPHLPYRLDSHTRADTAFHLTNPFLVFEVVEPHQCRC